MVVVDPPRKGCDKKLLDAISNIDAKRIVYVSCDPSTLARDLAILDQNGYETKIIQPVCDKKLLDAISNIDAKRIVYVSCDPSTLARDLAILDQNGYETKIIQPVDMFPHTAHIENVALLVKESSDEEK